MSSPLIPVERVLPTLNSDGSRRWIRPRLVRGRYYRARLTTAWALIALFVSLPFLRVGGKPAVLLNVPRREFALFGTTFLPTDGVLLMLLLLAIFVAVIFVTALFGRVWCGWACPQTVYMEFLFRPIERWFEARGRGSTGVRSTLLGSGKVLVPVLLAAVLGNVFLSYFVGVETLVRWMQSSPFQHPTPFLVMAVTSALVFADFGYFREQMCTVACPYARLQSVLLDRKSLIVAYDAKRGEPRGKQGKAAGDCVDCRLCVATCPTGIDIRDGLQLECIGCTQCIDACDGIMDKLARPTGLIRYTSEDALEKRSFSSRELLRPRTVIYPVLFAVLATTLVVLARGRDGFEMTVLRGIGAPFVEQSDGVRGHLRIKIQNRTSADERYTLGLAGLPEARLIAPENPMLVTAGQHATTSVFVLTPRSVFRGGVASVVVRASDARGAHTDVTYKLLGPEAP